MQIRRILFGISAALGLAAATLIAPQANAATLTIQGNTCTVHMSEADRALGRTIIKDWGENIVQGIRNELPEVAGDIDFLVQHINSDTADPGQLNQAVTHVNQAGVNRGFYEDEAVVLIAAGAALAASGMVPFDDMTFTRGQSPVLPDPGTPGGGDDSLSPIAEGIINNSLPAGVQAIGRWFRVLQNACDSNQPGTYNFTLTGGGGGGTGGGGNGGSSFLSS